MIECKKTSVARKRDLLNLFAAKCRKNTDKDVPSAHEIINSMIGDSSMFDDKTR